MKINIEQIKEIIRTVNKTTVLIYKDGTRQEFTGTAGMDHFVECNKMILKAKQNKVN